MFVGGHPAHIMNIAEYFPGNYGALSRRHAGIFQQPALHIQLSAYLIGEPRVVHGVVSLGVQRDTELFNGV